MIKIIPDMMKLQSYRTVYGFVSQHVRNEKLRQVLSFHPLLVGGNPFQTTSIYTLIHFLEKQVGRLVRHGRHRRTRGCDGAAIRGTRRHDHLQPGGRRNSGRRTPHHGCAVARWYRYACRRGRQQRRSRLDLPELAARRLSTQIHRPSPGPHALLDVACGDLFRDRPPVSRHGWTKLAHHDIILGKRYQPLLDDIFTKKQLADDFSLYLHVPTITDPSLAPAGCDSFYVLSPVPHLGSGTDWEQAARPIATRSCAFWRNDYLPDLSKHIVSEHMITPPHFRDTLNSYLGSAFSVEPILTQSAYFRPHNRSEELDNLYFVGAGTHPGAGMPGVMSSAKIVGDLIGNADVAATQDDR